MLSIVVNFLPNFSDLFSTYFDFFSPIYFEYFFEQCNTWILTPGEIDFYYWKNWVFLFISFSLNWTIYILYILFIMKYILIRVWGRTAKKKNRGWQASQWESLSGEISKHMCSWAQWGNSGFLLGLIFLWSAGLLWQMKLLQTRMNTQTERAVVSQPIKLNLAYNIATWA